MGNPLKTLVLFLFSVALSFLVSFCLIKAMPGNFGQDETTLSKIFIDSYKIELVPTVKSYFSGYWGMSWNQPERSVLSLIWDSFRFTIVLQIIAFIFIFSSSLLLSFLTLRYRWADKIIPRFTELGVSLPLLFITPLLIYVFILKLNWAPLRFDETSWSYWLPILCLSIRPLCFSAQILTQSWRETQFQDYFRVARAKGLSVSQVLWRHGLKNSVLGYLTQMAQVVGQLLTGSVLIETLFSFPGLGMLFVESLQLRDLPVLLGVVFVFCLIYMFVQITLEKLHTVFEPRAREKADV